MTDGATRPPADLASMFKLVEAMRPAAPAAVALPNDGGLNAKIATAIQALVIAIMLWVGKSVSDLQSAVAVMSARIELSTSDLSKARDKLDLVTTGLAANTASDALADQNVTRLKERVRVLEGQKPIDPPHD